jgi:primosomal protein N' (replication factor Y) (superfamily II helicase)
MPESHASSRPQAGRVSVLLPLPLAGAYDYAVPDELEAAPGDFVLVPLGRRELVGVVWGRGSDEVPASKLKPVIERLDLPPLPEVSRRFVDWVAGYSMVPPGLVLRMAMSVRAALEPPRLATGYRAIETPDPAVRITAPRARVLGVLGRGPILPAMDLAREAGVSPGVVRAMAEAGLIEPVLLPPPRSPKPEPGHADMPLEPAQRAAAATLVAKAGAGFSVTLIDGVTGSGKTAVYLEAIAAALKSGKQVLVLLPEIALTAQLLDRFADRFGVRPCEWHSDLTGPERRRNWRWIASGEARVVVGARSALFLPFRELGLIVVDEEHESAFKQEDGVIYHARDMAVVRAQLGAVPVALGVGNALARDRAQCRDGRYSPLHLPDRALGASLPTIAAVDLRRDRPPRSAGFPPALRMALEETLAAGEQALLFLNRRGYAPLTLCRACGHRLQCPNCTPGWSSIAFTGGCIAIIAAIAAICRRLPALQRGRRICRLRSGRRAAGGRGYRAFPEARLAVMTSDTMWSPGAAAEQVAPWSITRSTC